VDVSNKHNDKCIGILVGCCLKSRCHTFLTLGGGFLRECIGKSNHTGYETFQLEPTQLLEKRQHRTTASAIRPGPFLCQQEVAYDCFVVAWTHKHVNHVLVPEFDANQDGSFSGNRRTDEIPKNGWRFDCTVHLAHNGETKAGA